MANLPTDLDPIINNTQRAYEPKVLINDFGDGYSQRVPDGINTIRRTISVTFLGSRSDIDTYNNFFTNLAGASNFSWTPPGEDTERKWICPKWTITDMSNNIQELTATFREVYDLS